MKQQAFKTRQIPLDGRGPFTVSVIKGAHLLNVYMDKIFDILVVAEPTACIEDEQRLVDYVLDGEEIKNPLQFIATVRPKYLPDRHYYEIEFTKGENTVEQHPALEIIRKMSDEFIGKHEMLDGLIYGMVRNFLNEMYERVDDILKSDASLAVLIKSYLYNNTLAACNDLHTELGQGKYNMAKKVDDEINSIIKRLHEQTQKD